MLDIKGWVKTSLIDYPGKVVSAVFLPGCNFRCPYCQNPEMVTGAEGLADISMDDVIGYLKKHRDFLDGICITGGEPTLHKDVPDFIRKVKDSGFLVKLDTNGTNPDMLRRLIEEKLLDYIAMDIKAPLEKYDEVANVKVDRRRIQESIDIIKKSGVDYEFRTTVLPRLLSKEDMKKIAEWLDGAQAYYIQQFRQGVTLDPAYANERPYGREELEAIRKDLAPHFGRCEIRGI